MPEYEICVKFIGGWICFLRDNAEALIGSTIKLSQDCNNCSFHGCAIMLFHSFLLKPIMLYYVRTLQLPEKTKTKEGRTNTTIALN